MELNRVAASIEFKRDQIKSLDSDRRLYDQFLMIAMVGAFSILGWWLSLKDKNNLDLLFALVVDIGAMIGIYALILVTNSQKRKLVKEVDELIMKLPDND